MTEKQYGPTLPVSEEKRCWACKSVKITFDFHKGADRCKDCAKAYAKKYREENLEKARLTSKLSYQKNVDRHKKRVEVRRLEREYGLSQEDYRNLLVEHDNKCAICDKIGGVGLEKLVIDHCHKSGKVRGLLCRLCNTSLGGFQDSPHILNKAIQYVEKQNG